jgi:hypothetical protein
MRMSVAILLITACALMTGCNGPESSFDLAKSSRLPKWFTLPPGAQRKDISVRMDCYIRRNARDAVFTVKNSKIGEKKEVDGDVRGLYPPVLKDMQNEHGYPAYEVITVNGVSDIVEFRQMEPIFYMTDDPRVWKELGIPYTK